MTEHSFRVTRTTLSDGRELLYFDDSPSTSRGSGPGNYMTAVTCLSRVPILRYV